MNKKDIFIEIFKANIKREGSDKLLALLEKSDFFRAPASTRFHGSFEGGLLEHSLNVYNRLKLQISACGLEGEYSDETVAIVSLLHDICKINTYKKSKRNAKIDGKWEEVDYFEHKESFPCGHSEKSVIILQNYIHLDLQEIYAIRAHMGGFDSSVKGGDYFIGKIFENSNLALLTHIADMQATYLDETME